jgi:hypothetical protein
VARRRTKNRTGISRLDGIAAHSAWAAFSCVACNTHNAIELGNGLLSPRDAFEGAIWKCVSCGFTHSSESDLPFPNWPKGQTRYDSPVALRFWKGFFRTATENREAYWKRCNTCGRVLPYAAFSRHAGWGPLELQMECRSCKGSINAILNPKRTKQQLHESAVRRRAADILLEGSHEQLSIESLFERFNAKCFKSGRDLHMAGNDWAIDHILPSRYLYPLTTANAALLSREANAKKRDRWPSEYYTNSELIRLSHLTGADLMLLSSPTPILNPRIDVDACVARSLTVREHSNLAKRVEQLRKLIEMYGLVNRLSPANRKILAL